MHQLWPFSGHRVTREESTCQVGATLCSPPVSWPVMEKMVVFSPGCASVRGWWHRHPRPRSVRCPLTAPHAASSSFWGSLGECWIWLGVGWMGSWPPPRRHASCRPAARWRCRGTRQRPHCAGSASALLELAWQEMQQPRKAQTLWHHSTLQDPVGQDADLSNTSRLIQDDFPKPKPI